MGDQETPRNARAIAINLTLLGAVLTAPTSALADEGGVGFWLPGLFGSLAAAPLQPGMSVAAINYYDSVHAGGDVALAKEVQIGHFTTNLHADINGSLNSRIDLAMLIPSYTFEQHFLGAQANASMLMVVPGSMDTTLQGMIAGTLGPFGFSRFGSRTDDVVEAGDLYPMFNLRWNEGVNNLMTYITGDIPVGGYQRTSLSNISIGHYALDGGAGYTYLNPQTGYELSAVAGFTNNYTNPPTIRTASISTLTGARRSFSPSGCSSARSAMSTTSSPATAAAATTSGPSNLASSASARRSATSFRSEIFRAT
jgi:hypothetical protein